MGQYVARDARGTPFLFNISGSAPNPAESSFIQNYITRGGPAPAPPPPPEKPGIMSLLGSSAMSGINQIQAGLEDIPQSYFEMTGQKDRAKYWEDLAKKDRTEAAAYTTADTGVTDASSWGDRFRSLVSTAGQSAPSMGLSLAAAYPGALVGAELGAPLGPLGAAAGGFAGGVIGIAAGMYPQTLEANVQRQQQEHPNKPINWTKAHEATVGSALVEGLSDMTILKVTGALGKVGGKLVGPEFSKLVGEAAHNAIGNVATKYAKEIAKGGGEALLTGATEETIQQGLERWQADLPLMDDQAKKEYLESAIQGGILESMFGAGAGAVGAHKEIAHEKKLNQLREDHEADVTAAQTAQATNVPANQAAREAPYNLTPPPPEPLPTKPIEGQLQLTDQSAISREQKYFEAQDNMLPPGLQDEEVNRAKPPTEPVEPEAEAEPLAASKLAPLPATPEEALMQRLTPEAQAKLHKLRGTTPTQEQAEEGIPFVITQAARVRLADLGYAPEDIRTMTPREAKRITDLDLQKFPDKLPPLPTSMPEPTTADVSRETSPPGTTLKEGEQGPLKKLFGSEQDYRAAVTALRPFKSVSYDRIKQVLGVKQPQAEAIFAEMLRRNDAHPAGDKNQYLQVTVPHGMASREGSNETGQQMPRRSRDYIVKPVQPANLKPYSIELQGKKLGKNLRFTTREEAQAYIDNQVPAGKKGNATVAEDLSGMQYGIHELQYQHHRNGEQKLVGSKVVNTYSTEDEAKEALKGYDRAYSPESNKWREQMPAEDKQAAVTRDYAQTMGPIGEQLAAHAEQVVGKGKVALGMQPTLTAESDPTAIVEGQAENLYERDPNGIKKVVRSLIMLATDLYNPNLTTEQRTKLLRDVLNHELIHVIRNLDLLKPKEWKTLALAANRNVPGKLYSWRERAAIRNQGATEGVIQEEAIAEMFRHYMNDPTAFRNPERALLRKLADFVKRMMGLAKRHDAEDLMDSIFGGGIADRDIGTGGMGKRSEEDTFYSLIKPDNFYLQSNRFLDGVRQEEAKKNDWIKMLKNPSTGIKQSELDWLQLIPWLESQPSGQTIRKQDIQNYITASGPRVSTTIKADLTHPFVGAHAALSPTWKERTQVLNPRNYMEAVFTFPPAKDEPLFAGGVHATVWGSTVEGDQPYFGNQIAIPNVLAFARLRDVYKGGNKYLFIEEIQSDLHQQGSMNGYYSQSAMAKAADLQRHKAELDDQWSVLMTQRTAATSIEERSRLDKERVGLEAKMEVVNEELGKARRRLKIPNAPFKTNWEDYVIRRLIRHAAESQYAGIVWHGSPESVADTEGYDDLATQLNDKGKPQYTVGGPGGAAQSVTPIINRYIVKLPKIVRALAEPFGATLEHNRVAPADMGKDENGRPLANRGGYVPSDVSEHALQERYPDLQALEDDFNHYWTTVAGMGLWRDPADQIEANGIMRVLGKVMQTARNLRQFDANQAFDIVGMKPDHILQFVRTADTGNYYGDKGGEEVGGEDSPFANDHFLLDFSQNPGMTEDFERGDQPFFSMIKHAKQFAMADPKFQNWFTGSVVTDADGSPKPVFHFSSADEPFGSFRRLSHFGTATAARERFQLLARRTYAESPQARDAALMGSSTYPVFLNLHRPLVITDDKSNHNAFSYGMAMKDAGIISEDRFRRIMAQRTDAVNNYTADGEQQALSDLINELEKAGYDGFQYTNRGEDQGSTSYVTIRENQIKSVNNPGLWSEDSDIMFSRLKQRGADLLADNDKFKHWFNNSRVVDEHGDPLLMFHGTSKDMQFTKFKIGGRGAWFTGDAADASMYANENDSQRIVPDPKMGDPWALKRVNTASRVAPVFLSIQNPYVMTDAMLRDFNNQRGSYQKLQKNLFEQLKVGGYDGVKMGDRTWVAFNEGQIKSALANEFVNADDAARYSLIKPLYSQTAPLGQRVPVTPPIDTLSDVHNRITYDNLSPVVHKIIDYLIPGSQRKATAKGKVDTTFISLQDRMLPVGRLIDRIKKNGGFISTDNDSYLRQTLYTGQTDTHLTSNDNKFYKPLLTTIQGLHVTSADYNEAKRLSPNAASILGRYANNIKHALAELYLYAQHAQERNAVMRERNEPVAGDRPLQYEAGSGMGDGEAQAILDWFASKPFGAEFNSEMNQNSVRSRMRALVANTNDVRVAGDLTPDFRTMRLADGRPADPYKDYVPLRGLLDEATYNDEDMKEFAKTGKGFNIRGREDFAALGRGSLGSDVVAHAVMQNQESVVRAGKNKVTQSFRQLILDNPAEFAGGVGQPKVAEIMHMPRTKYSLDRERGVVVQRQDMTVHNDPTILKGKYDNGQQFYIKLYDPRLVKAFGAKSGLGNVGLDGLLKGLMGLNRFMAMVRTSLNPEFTISNGLRDLSTALINVSEYEQKGLRRKVIASVLPAMKGVRDALRRGDMTSEWGKVYDEFTRFGGQTAIFGIKELDDTIKHINKHFEEDPSGAAHKVMQPIKALGKFIEDYNLAVENGTRLSTYKALRDKYLEMSGDPTNPVNQKRAKEMAAFAAKNMTVNFNMGGEAKGVMSALYLFYNASLQGSMALLNPFIRSRKMKKVWASVLVAGIVQDMLMSMLSPEGDDGEKEYDRIPDYVLEHNMVFMDPFGISERGYLKIPLPYLMNGIYNWGRALGRTARGKYSMGQMMSSGGMTMVDSLNPWGGSNSLLNFVAPSIIDPVVDLYQNEDFTGKPIAPPVSPYDNTGINRSQQYWNNTNPAFVTIADWMSKLTGRKGDYIPGVMEYSPNQVEYVWNWLTGGAGAFAARAANVGFTAQKGELPDAGDVPFLRAFTGSVTTKNDLQRYVEGRDQVLRVRESLRSARKEGDNEAYLRIMREYPDEYKAASRINAIENARKKLGTKIKHIRDSTRIPDAEKEIRIKQLKDRQDALVGSGNQVISQAGI